MESEYRHRTIQEEIDHKINTLNKTRNNRINASERLYSYSNKWNIVFFFMNVIAVIMLVTSIYSKGSSTKTMISGIFSLYTIITQYVYNSLNYRERALKFHYNELELESQILELKNLSRRAQKAFSDEYVLELKYKAIIEKYIATLKGYENHDNIDNIRSNNPNKHLIFIKDIDFYFFIINIITLLVFTVFYII